jgi:hypothetical protein
MIVEINSFKRYNENSSITEGGDTFVCAFDEVNKQIVFPGIRIGDYCAGDNIQKLFEILGINIIRRNFNMLPTDTKISTTEPEFCEER